ncbi:MAG: carboxypeptidase-like regulatory domain-containing protein, partial [Acidobacteriota bacterium]
MKIEGEPQDSVSGAALFEAKTVSIPGRVALEVPTGTSNRLTLEGDGLWSPPLLIVAGPERQNLTWRVWPTGSLTGQLQGDPAAFPRSLDLTLWPRSSGFIPDEIKLRCSVSVLGAWSCEVPEGIFDWRLGKRGFVSHYGWAQEVQAGEETLLPPRPFVRGSSVVGWVHATKGLKLDPKTSVAWKALGAEGPENSAGPPADTEVALSFIDEPKARGFFQFTTPPGRYRVSVRRADRAASQEVELTVHANLEARLIDPLLLGQQADLELNITPWTGPDGMPWQVFLSSERVPEPDHSLASWQGHWHRKGLAEGAYRLVIKSYTHDIWWSEQIELLSGEPVRQVHLARLRVDGRLLVGEDPAAATIWFGGQGGAESHRFESDSTGSFEGSLPRDGPWPVDILLHRGGQELSIRRVLVESVATGYAEVQVQLPGVRVRGEVVDGLGTPVAGATIRSESADEKAPSASTRSDEDGRFTLSGVASEQISLHAWTREASSRVEIVQLPPDEPAEVRLELESKKEISGQIHDAGGAPVFGAEVYGFPQGLDGHWILRGLRDR